MTGRWSVVAVVGLLAAIVGWFTHPVLTVFALVLVLTIGGIRWWHRWSGSAALVNRWTAWATKHQGVASPWRVLRGSSWWTLRRNAKNLLPELRDVSVWARWRHPITELGVHLIRVGWVRAMSSIEEQELALGAPRRGKSGLLGDRLADAPGAALCTSTGPDLYRNTASIRERVGPVYVFNPCNVGGLPTTIGFDLLTGCETVKVVRDRAGDLLGGTPISGTTKDPEWLELATSALASLMHAAALGGRTMHHVQMWVADPEAAAPEVMHYLKASPVMRMEAGQFLTNERSRGSICMLIMSALRWVADPAAVACTRSGSLDVEQFLTDRGTIYLLAEKDGTVTPLINAFAMHITRSARRIADQQQHQRLPRAFTAVLDEAPLICPMDLPSLTSDSGKRNIKLHIGAQSIPQLKSRWGEDGARALLTNCATIWLFGGTKDPDGLATFSTLIGHSSPGRSVLTPDQFTRLPKLHAVLFRDEILPVVGKPRMVWHRRDYRAAQRTAVWAPRWLAVRRVFGALDRRRRVVVPAKPMLALPPGRSDQTQPQWQPGLVQSGSDLN
ncbi:MAG: TraM recognition domain-containing protein [Actinobacteria bacterium]|nr:TraM recognition domain-containing protein [Actinomycetota bacterium]